MHVFEESLRRGAIGEANLDLHFAQWFEIRAASDKQQRQGIDRWFCRQGKTPFAVEYKTDFRACKTGNAFIEIVSVDSAQKGGWVYTSHAYYLMYYLPQLGLVYMLKLSTLRGLLEQWTAQYQVKPACNIGYKTWGLLVPLHEFEKHAYRVIEL